MEKKKQSLFFRRTLSNIVVICVGVLLFIGLSNFHSIRKAISSFSSVFLPFWIGIVIAYLLNMPMSLFERTLFKNKPVKEQRALSLLLTYLLAFVIVSILIGLVTPQLAESVRTLIDNAPRYLENLNRLANKISNTIPVGANAVDTLMLSYEDVVNSFFKFINDGDTISKIVNVAGRIGSGVAGGIMTFFTALIASIYMLIGRDKLLVQGRRLLYAATSQRLADRVMYLGALCNKIFSGFIGGKLLDSAIIGVITFISLSIMNIISSLFNINGLHMPFSVLISVIIGVTNIIPFFGPFIGAVPCAMILLMVNPVSTIWFIVFIIVLQQVDGNIIGPKILGDSTGLPPMWVFVAIILGGGLFGFMGMLLGVPTVAVIYVLVGNFVEKNLRKKGLDEDPELKNQ